MSGKIKKSKKEKNFTVVPNAYLRRVDLSWKAKGLMTYLLSLDDDWDVHKSDLANRSKDGYESMISAWKELENEGYITTNKIKIGSLFKGYEYFIHESPVRGFPETEIPLTENPQLRNNSLKKDTKVSNVGLGKPTPTDGGKSINERCTLFINKFNSIKVVNGKKSRYKESTSLCSSLKSRLKKYDPQSILNALELVMKDDFHIKNNFKYVTPEYILRERVLERYLNSNMGESSLEEYEAQTYDDYGSGI